MKTNVIPFVYKSDLYFRVAGTSWVDWYDHDMLHVDLEYAAILEAAFQKLQ